jgi:hypothetical protein
MVSNGAGQRMTGAVFLVWAWNPRQSACGSGVLLGVGMCVVRGCVSTVLKRLFVRAIRCRLSVSSFPC